MKTTLLQVVLLLTVHCAVYAQIDLSVEASKTEGVAPLYVFFDATSSSGLSEGNDLVNSDFSWNFDQNDTDPNGNWEITKGMVAGHVFEAPGTYEVSCTLTAPDGTTDTETISITVTEFSGTTYYVSEDGSDGNDGLSEANAWQTAQFAFQQIDGNDQVLFRRGDSFSGLTQNLDNINNGPIIVGAYGSAEEEKPIIISDDGVVINIRNSSNIRVMDLHIITTGEGVTTGFASENSENILALRLEIEQTSNRTLYQDEATLLGVFDCYLHDFGVLAIFSGSSTRFSFVGNEVDNLLGAPQPEHGMRIQEGEKQFIAHNTLTRLDDTKTAMTIRGEGQRHVMVYRNKMDRILGVNPTNAQSVQAISYVVLEGNYIGHNEDYIGNDFEPTINGINIEATRIAIRNNIIDGYRNAIFVGHDYNGVVSGWVDVYHNTIHWRPVTEYSSTSGKIVNVRDVSNVNIQNNLISASNESDIIVVNDDDGSTDITFSNNLVTSTPGYTTASLPNSAAHQNSIINYRLLEESPAIGIGDGTVPVFFDINNNPRTTYDVGAYEYTEASTITQSRDIESIQHAYPNPFTNSVTFKNTSHFAKILVYDIAGSLVFRSTMESETVDLSFLKSGVYSVVIADHRERQHFRIVKN